MVVRVTTVSQEMTENNKRTLSANPNVRADQIVAAFQRYLASSNSTEVHSFSLQQLRSADEQLGQRDIGASFRIAIQNRIKDLEELDRRQHESKIRAWNLVTGIIIGLVVAGLTKFLFGT